MVARSCLVACRGFRAGDGGAQGKRKIQGKRKGKGQGQGKGQAHLASKEREVEKIFGTPRCLSLLRVVHCWHVLVYSGRGTPRSKENQAPQIHAKWFALVTGLSLFPTPTHRSICSCLERPCFWQVLGPLFGCVSWTPPPSKTAHQRMPIGYTLQFRRCQVHIHRLLDVIHIHAYIYIYTYILYIPVC